MLHLKTLGGLSVAVDGAAGSGAAQQRKTLALLALLAVAGRRGLSRDKLVAYLWPEADAARARGLLNQACYALRRDLHTPDLFLGSTELRLNARSIRSDLEAFEAALERGDEVEAAGLYAGPFLDGFYLSEAAEFERWVEAERDRLRQLAGRVLEKVATDAAARGDQRRAVEWWRRLAVFEPLNSRVALALMNALTTVGDRAGALEVARVHEKLLREELDAAPDAEVVELSQRLRAFQPSPGPRLRAGAEAVAREERGENGASAWDGAPEPGRESPEPSSRKARKRVAVGLALLAGGLLIGGWLRFSAPFAAEPKSLVVLPFTNLGAADQEYFADGIAEEITARLAALGDLRVIGSTSASAYKGTKKTIPEIGRELGVAYVLEGSVRWQKSQRGQARVRITPQLVNAADGTHVWAQVYDEPLDEIFRVQSDIAQRVVQALDVTLLEPQRLAVQAVPTRNLEAYDYYLRGIEYWRRGREERFQRAALQMFEEAVELDSTFALAWAMVARMHSRMYAQYWDRSQDRLAQAKRAVDQALRLQPALPEAHQSLGHYYSVAHADFDRALHEFAITEASRPSEPRLYSLRAVVLSRQGKYAEALADFERALELEPHSAAIHLNSGEVFDLTRDFERAEPRYDRAIALAPDLTYPYFLKAGLHLRRNGNTPAARAVLDEAERVGLADAPYVVLARVQIAMFDRRYDEALARLASAAPDLFADQLRFTPKAELYAQVYGLMQRHDLERAYYDSARSIVAERLRDQPDDARLHSALGIAYAGLGRKEEAIVEGRRGVELRPISKDRYQGYYRPWDLARIYVMVGEDEAAVDRLEYLLSIPGYLTRAWLRVDPTWDPLRSHPRFKELLDRGR
jgi:TolB-like protein/DNA-binding SARP family transcriptional activator/Tfp pilus assembly protein PilF